MWMVVILLVFSGLCAAFELASLMNAGDTRDRWAFASLLLLGTGLGTAMILKVSIPNPLDGIAAIYEPIGIGLQRLLR